MLQLKLVLFYKDSIFYIDIQNMRIYVTNTYENVESDEIYAFSKNRKV